ncbi:MAG: ATP-binding cassette domain-containing protein [Verrucomicrobiota bacterium]
MPGSSFQIDRLSWHVGSVQAVHDVTLALPPQARCVVAGPSGAGKTSLLRLIAGLQSPSGGTIHQDGTDITPLPPERRGFGWVGPDPSLLPGLDAVAQVEVALRLVKSPPNQSRETAIRALESFGLGHRLRHLPHQLSSGEALRVALARASVFSPRCLLLDEPFARIDPAQRSALHRWLARWQEETGGTIMETSHWLHESLLHASHLLLLRKGRPIQFGETREIWRFPSSPWVADYLSILPVWWSIPADARQQGWHGPISDQSASCKLLGVRLDLASWHRTPSDLPCLGPLRVVGFHDVGWLPCVQAVFPDGEVRLVPWRCMDPFPTSGDVGWAWFNTNAVVEAMQDDRA